MLNNTAFILKLPLVICGATKIEATEKRTDEMNTFRGNLMSLVI